MNTPRAASDIIKDIDRFQPNDGQWLALDQLLQELFQSGSPAIGIDAMLRVLERFPAEDGAGVFWSIVHGLESLPGYEEPLVASVCSLPSEFGIIMIHRLLNSGVNEVADVHLLSLLEATAKNVSIQEEVRNRAARCLAKYEAES